MKANSLNYFDVRIDAILHKLIVAREVLERLDDQARLVLLCAQSEAYRFNHRHIHAEHLILGILKEAHSSASQNLVRSGMELVNARAACEAVVSPERDSVEGNIPFTPAAHDAIEFACAIVEAQSVSPDDILSALKQRHPEVIQRMYGYTDQLPAKPNRRWWQYGVGTMLVVVTALCVALGVVASRAERQRKAVAAIEALGGMVGYGNDDPETPERKAASGRRLPRDWTEDVSKVWFGPRTKGTDAGLAHLRGLHRLEALILDGCDVTDAGLAQLHGLDGLEVLLIYETSTTDRGLMHLQGVDGLGALTLKGVPVTDAGLRYLHGLRDLQLLTIERTNVTNAGVAELQKALPNCRIVH